MARDGGVVAWWPVEGVRPLLPSMVRELRRGPRQAGIGVGIFALIMFAVVLIPPGQFVVKMVMLAFFAALACGLWVLLAGSALLDLRDGKYRVTGGAVRQSLGALSIGPTILPQYNRLAVAGPEVRRLMTLPYAVVVTSWSRAHVFAIYDHTGAPLVRNPPHWLDPTDRAAIEALVATALLEARRPPGPPPPEAGSTQGAAAVAAPDEPATGSYHRGAASGRIRRRDR